MAQVHLAVSRGVGGFNKLVVLKWLDSADDSFRSMFLDEARLAALLHHPNVVDTYEVSENAGSYFIAMEYLEGQPLDKLIREARKAGRQLEPRLCARIVADALAGLHYTHELRDYTGAPLEVVHRDVSPHNLFLTYDGTVKVLDFGVAKTTVKTSETEVGVLKGKLAYMAPEQAAAQPLDRRADIFAVGAVFWELLTLERLRKSDSAAGVLNEAIHGQLPDLAKARPGVSRHLETILWQALAHYPRRRYQTALEMREALLEYLSSDPCPQEQLAEYMQQHFGELREKVQRQVADCLRHAEAQDPVISVTGEEEAAPVSVPSLSSNHSRSLPLLDSGSLPPRHDDATAPLGPGAMLPSSHPPPPRQDSATPARSRSLSFGEESHDESGGTPRRWLPWVAVAACAVLAVLWSRRPNAESLPVTSQPSPALAEHGDVVLRLHGSNTIGQELAPRLAEAFLKQRGYANVERGAPGERSAVVGRDPHDGKTHEVEIVAQGSSTAFSDLARGQCDVGMSSRRIKPEEVAHLQAKGLGDLESAAGEHVLGLDGIAVIVHPNSAIERLDLDALRRIFTGEATDFSSVGDGRGPTHVYARDDRSGTFDTFKHLVLGERPLAPQAQRFADSVELSGAVARDEQGIGFIAIPYVRGARALAVGAPGAALYPSSFTVATEGYELSRRLYLYLPVQGVKPLAQEFVSFALSAAGQEAVRAAGFVDLTLRATATGACQRCPARYAELSRSSRRLSLDFRFRKGSAELDNRGLRDLDRLVAFLRENSQSRLVLVGFSDSRGSAPQNSRLSLERAKKISSELSERGVRAVDIEAMGSALPVASNESETGREKNRRVEVWLR